MSETQTETPPAEVEQPDPEPSELEPDTEPGVDEDPDQTEGVDAQAQPVGKTPEQYEAIRKKLDQSAETWRKRVRDLLEDDADVLVPCELCAFELPGFHWPAELVQPINETHDRLLRVLREPAAPEYRDATQVRQCADCAGWGKVRSGSHLASHELVTCPACKGYGYTPPPIPSQNGYAEVANVQPAGVGLDEDESEPPTDADIWGSPRLLPDGQENPNYGKMPQYKSPTLP